MAQMLSIHSSCPPIRNDVMLPVSTTVPRVPPGTGPPVTETATPPNVGGAAAMSPTKAARPVHGQVLRAAQIQVVDVNLVHGEGQPAEVDVEADVVDPQCLAGSETRRCGVDGRHVEEGVPTDLEVGDGHRDAVGRDDDGSVRLTGGRPVLGTDRDRRLEVDADVCRSRRRSASGNPLHVQHRDLIPAGAGGVHRDHVELGGALDDDEALQEVTVEPCQFVDVRVVDLERLVGPELDVAGTPRPVRHAGRAARSPP